MQHLQNEQQQPIPSQSHVQSSSLTSFKQYLVSSGCVLHLIKFLLGIRNKQKSDNSIPNQDVLKMFYDYIGAVEIDSTQYDGLREQVQIQKEQNLKLRNQVQRVKKEIQELKEEKQRKKKEEQKKREEEEANKAKKGGKK